MEDEYGNFSEREKQSGFAIYPALEKELTTDKKFPHCFGEWHGIWIFSVEAEPPPPEKRPFAFPDTVCSLW
jgi:hypothetical protein